MVLGFVVWHLTTLSPSLCRCGLLSRVYNDMESDTHSEKSSSIDDRATDSEDGSVEAGAAEIEEESIELQERAKNDDAHLKKLKSERAQMLKDLRAQQKETLGSVWHCFIRSTGFDCVFRIHPCMIS